MHGSTAAVADADKSGRARGGKELDGAGASTTRTAAQPAARTLSARGSGGTPSESTSGTRRGADLDRNDGSRSGGGGGGKSQRERKKSDRGHTSAGMSSEPAAAAAASSSASFHAANARAYMKQRWDGAVELARSKTNQSSADSNSGNEERHCPEAVVYRSTISAWGRGGSTVGNVLTRPTFSSLVERARGAQRRAGATSGAASHDNGREGSSSAP